MFILDNQGNHQEVCDVALACNEKGLKAEANYKNNQNIIQDESLKLQINYFGDDRIKDDFDNDQIFDTLNISKSRKLKDLF